MIPLALTIAAATAAGFGTEHRVGELRAQRVADLTAKAMLWVLIPPVVFFNIATLHLTAGVGAGLAFGYLGLGVAMLTAYAAGRWVFDLSRPGIGALMLAAAMGNTGYLGVPFTAALFGLDDVPDALAYDIVISGMGFFTIAVAVGAAFGSVAEAPRARVAAFFTRNPALWAFAAALVAPTALAPQWAVDASHVLVFVMLPMGFFIVGVTLASEAEEGAIKFPPPITGPVAAAVGIKLLLVPAVVLLLSLAIIEVPDPYISQAAMACGINSVLIAHAYGLDRNLAASAIAWSTAIVVAAGLVVALI